jgi:hypothetical protein
LKRCALIGIQAIVPKSLNPTKLAPLKATLVEREDLLTKMLDDTYDYLSKTADTSMAEKTLPLDKFKNFFKEFIPGIKFETDGLDMEELAGKASLDTKFNDETFKKSSFELLCKVDKKDNINLDSNYFGLLMHELTHLYEQLAKPKTNLTYSKLLGVNKEPEKAIGSIIKWNKIYGENIYSVTKVTSKKAGKETFRKTLNEELQKSNLAGNYEKIQYLKEFYTSLNMEKRAYASSAKYTFRREKEYVADYNKLASTVEKKPKPKESDYTSPFEKLFQFEMKLAVLKEELLKAIKVERDSIK